MSTNRPDWASGPEWEGWEMCGSRHLWGATVHDAYGDEIEFSVGKDGDLIIDRRFCLVFTSPEHARRAAEAIIREMGEEA